MPTKGRPLYLRGTPPKPPSLSRIFDHKGYAEAARQDHDERVRDARKVYRHQRRRRDVGETLGYVLIAAAMLIAIFAAAFALVGAR